MSIVNRWNGSAWELVPDGTSVKIWNGSAWVVPDAIRYWNGAAWMPAWSKSDPITLSFYPTFATHLRWSGSAAQYDGALTSENDAAADLFLGRFNGSAPYHYTTLLRFAGDSIQGAGTLAAALATRPVVHTASLRLYRMAGGYASPSGYLRTGVWTQASPESLPATTLNGTYHDWDPVHPNDVAGWSIDTIKYHYILPEHIYDHAAGKALMFSEVQSGYTTSGGTTFAYMRIYGMVGSDVNKLPVLTVTLDVV